MDSLQAAVLAIKLKRLDAWNTARADRAAFYTELLKNSSYKLPTHLPDSECVWHCYVIETPERDRVHRVLDNAGIETAIHYPVPVHVQQAYVELGYVAGSFPNAERACREVLSLPLYPELTEEEGLDRVVIGLALVMLV